MVAPAFPSVPLGSLRAGHVISHFCSCFLGRKPYKRKTWVKAEVDAIEKHLMRFIESRRLPGKAECVRCLQAEPEALKRRDWLAIKFYTKNRIAALKIKK